MNSMRLVKVWVFFAACTGWFSRSIADFEGDPKHYLEVAEVWRKNVSSIKTWSGKADTVMENLGIDSKVRGKFQRVQTEFWYVSDGDLYRRDYVLDVRVSRDKDKLFKSKQCDILRPDGFFAFGPIDLMGKKENRDHAVFSVRGRDNEKQSLLSLQFFPFTYMSPHGPDYPVDQKMTISYEQSSQNKELAKVAGREMLITRMGEVVQTRVVNGGTTFDFRYDLSKGGLPVQGFWQDDGVVSTLSCVPQNVSGAWIPKDVSYVNRIGTKDHREYTVSYDDQRINEPMDRAIFDPDKYKLEDGDLVVNTLTKEQYRHNVSSESSSLTKHPPQAFSLKWLILGLLVGGVLLLLVLKRSRKT